MSGKKYCYFCKNYHESLFCGYSSCGCKIYGSLDIDQSERHPDKTANTCIHYNERSNIEDNQLYQFIKNREAENG